MERMLRATGKFHIVPIYQPVEEHVEEGEDNHFDFGGPRGRITATSTPVRTVPRSFSAEPPSYKLVRPPTPRPNSVRFRDQDTSYQNENTLSQNQDHVSQETHDRAPLTHVNFGQYNVPTPNVRVPLSTVHEELGSHTISETLHTNTTFGKSQYEQRPPPSSQHEQRPLPSSQYEQRPPPRSQYEQMPPLSSQHEQMPPLNARHRQIPSLPPLQPQMKQEASYMPPSVPPVYNKTDNGTPPPQTSCKTDQAFQTDIRVKQLGYPPLQPMSSEFNNQHGTRVKQVYSEPPPPQRCYKPEVERDVIFTQTQQCGYEPNQGQQTVKQEQLHGDAPVYNSHYYGTQQMKGVDNSLPRPLQFNQNMGFGQTESNGHNQQTKRKFVSLPPPHYQTYYANYPPQTCPPQNIACSTDPVSHKGRQTMDNNPTHTYYHNPMVTPSNQIIGNTFPNTWSASYNTSDMTGMRPPQIPFFSGEDQKGDVSFEVWKFELNCCIREHYYPDSLILQAIRKSLRGKARDILLTLGEDATPSIILNKLEGIYGNVCSEQILLQQFYVVSQNENESSADYSIRLENLLRRATQSRPVDEVTKHDMLCSRFWNGLRDPHLKNSCRFMFETEKDFNKLRKYIRSVEQDLNTSEVAQRLATASSGAVEKVSKETKTAAQSLHTSDKSSQKIDNMFNQVKQLREKLKDMERKFAEASLQAKSNEPSSSDPNPPPTEHYLPKR